MEVRKFPAVSMNVKSVQPSLCFYSVEYWKLCVKEAQFTAKPLEGDGCVFTWFQGGLNRLLFFSARWWIKATELEKLFLEMEMIDIEQQMLLLQMLKPRHSLAEAVCPNGYIDLTEDLHQEMTIFSILTDQYDNLGSFLNK